MKQITGNEPVHPYLNPVGMIDTPGLTIRQHFAGLAMQGIIANSPDWTDTDAATDYISKAAVKLADALLKQLNEGI